ncbi:MAG: hypothetical protein HOV80_34580 [Polyangiaceae bacterium]|nr:hypothetical protein [Polyangiaceae bacterium]
MMSQASQQELLLPLIQGRVSAEEARAILDELGGAATMQELPPVPAAQLVRALRALALRDEALLVAKRQWELAPSYETSVALGATLKEAGDFAGARAAFEHAAKATPERVEPWLDAGDASLELDDPNRAREAYGRALELEPGQAWAHASMLYLHARSGEAAARRSLQSIAEHQGPRTRAWELCERLAPYRLVLPSPVSILIDWVAELAGSGLHVAAPGTARTTIQLSRTFDEPDAPSAEQAYRSAVARLARATRLDLDIELDMPTAPLPLWPEGRTCLWRLDEGVPVPALGPPRHDMTVLIRIAASPYDLDAWWSESGAWAADRDDAHVASLLSLMASPPEIPHHVALPPWLWNFRVQVAAALAIAQVGEAWAGSRRQQALRDLIEGPIDWTTTAAIVALSQLRTTSAALAADIDRLLSKLDDRGDGPLARACVVEPLRRCASWSGAGPPRTR